MIYKPPTRYAVAKTYSPKFCKPPTRFAVVKTHSPKFCKCPTGQKMSCGGQNALSEPLQAFYMPHGGQIALSKANLVITLYMERLSCKNGEY